MNVTSKISVDLTRQCIGGRVNAVQGDGNTRYVEITLLAGGAPWTPPEGVEAAIAYMQPSGTKGMYNLLADGTAAISISGNVATVTLAPQMITDSGTVQASLVFNDQQLNRLTTFPFSVSVVSNPAAGAQKTEDYIRLQWLEDKLDEYLRKASENMEFVGPQGQKGDKGDKGDRGDVGPAGEPGVSPTINQKGPDETGNVTLTAADVGALAVSGGDMEGAINMNGKPISGLNDPTEDTQAARKGYVDASVRKAAPRNILDNSDFTNPVNQRGKTSYATSGYCIDRWKNMRDDVITLTDGGIYFLSNKNVGGLYQFVEGKRLAGKTVTAAVKIKNNQYAGMLFGIRTSTWGQYVNKSIPVGDSLLVVTATIPSDETGNVPISIWVNDNSVAHSFDLEWAALYEGEYTAETLPEYQPKGYGAELAECQRYFQVVKSAGSEYITPVGFGYATSATSGRICIPIVAQMRDNVVPSIETNGGSISVKFGTGSATVSDITVMGSSVRVPTHSVIVSATTNGLTTNQPVILTITGGELQISADL